MRVGKKYKIGEAEEKKPHKVPYIKRFWPTYFVPRFKELKHDCGYKSENKLQAKVFKFVGHKY